MNSGSGYGQQASIGGYDDGVGFGQQSLDGLGGQYGGVQSVELGQLGGYGSDLGY